MRTALLLAAALATAPADTTSTAAARPEAALAPATRAAPPPCPPELFRIARSTNANQVVYAARLARGGGLDKADPLSAEWHMLAEDGLKAKKDRPVHLTLRNGCPAALVRIAGRPGVLKRIFVQTGAGGVIPTVAWADLEGEDPENGDSLFERVYPKN